MINDRAGISRGLVTITLIVSALISAETSAKTTDMPLARPVDYQTNQATEPSSRLKQLYSAHQQARVQNLKPVKASNIKVDDQYPSKLEALHDKGIKQAAEAAIRLAQYYAEQQKWPLAESFMGEALQLQPDNIVYLKMAAQFAYDQKNYGQAEKLILKAMQQVQQLPEFKPQQLLNLQDNLAIIYTVKGQYQNAQKELQQTLQVRYQTLGETHPDIAKNLIKLGIINALQKELEKAEDQLSSALSMLQPEEKNNADLIAYVKRNLGEIKRTRSQLDAAGVTLQ